MRRFALVAVFVLAASLAATTPAAAQFRVAGFGAGAGWIETTTPPPGETDPSSIELSATGTLGASVTFTGFGARPPAFSPSYDFRPSAGGPSGGSPRLTIRFSNGGGELRPLSLVAGQWTHEDGSTDWDSYGARCGFRPQLSYEELLGCHQGEQVTGVEIWNDSGWLHPGGLKVLVDNVTYGGETVSKQDTDVLRGGAVESPGRITAKPTSGEVLVRLPRDEGSGEFVPLENVADVPVRSVVDARNGSIELSTAPDSSGRLQVGEFSAGAFQLLRPRGRAQDAGVTELRMRGPRPGGCGGSRAQAASLTRQLYSNVHHRRHRRLGRSTVASALAGPQGGFRVRTRNSTTRASEAAWRTVDRCDGTLTRVTRGRVVLRDLRRKISKVLGAGKSYVAKGP